MREMPPCMGGFCKLRESCEHYGKGSEEHPSERLCLPGRDGVIEVVRPIQQAPEPAEVKKQLERW